MQNALSYRIGNPHKPAIPLARCAALGIPCLEISLGDQADAGAVKQMLAEHGLRASTLTSPCPTADDTLFDVFETKCAQAAALGCDAIFTSVKTGELALEAVYDRLRRVGDIAQRHGVRIGMETHPPLCENGAKAAATLAAVNHPNIGINYDTANVCYYNEGAETVAELRKIAPHVVSVHLKDTMGGFKNGAFPEFGKGIVDFAGVFGLLNARGFFGPFTMELEGKLTSSADPGEQEAHVRACVEHLRGLGLVP
ncbi:MAG: sugar phosphate isomerase/epimerase [Kiritimatiellae bacterium]|nr:sugar phosphate isomerase/epimerase [Kiritimatiellia bacterium]